MTERWDAIVVGAGITGLAAGAALARRGRRVLVLDRAGIGTEQSAGLGRIFRIAHADPALCALALEARDGWRRWERELGAGRLLGEEGFVSAAPDAPGAQGAAMAAAGAAAEVVGREDLERLVPHLAGGHPWAAGLHDPLGGSLRVRRALQALAARLDVRAADVVAAADGEDGASVRLRDGSALGAEHVLLCAGTATAPLAATAGLAVPVRFTHHVRLTYAPRAGVRPGPSACLAAAEGYGLPLGSTGRWALGLRDPGDPAPYETADVEAYAAAVRRQHAEVVPHLFRGFGPEPVDEVRCVAVHAPWLDAHEDGFAALRRGRVVACTGSNLMKFGPLLGDRLARTVLDGDDVHPDLRPVVRGATA